VGYRFRSDEEVVERDAVPPEFDYVAAGHIHRHQVLQPTVEGGPPIVYAGSPDRVSFAERDEPKGCVLVELGDGGVTHRFIEHAVRPMRIVPLNVTGMDAAGITAAIGEVLTGLPPNVIASLRLSGRVNSGQLKGLGLAGLVREIRPEALINVSTQAIEYASPEPGTRGTRPDFSAFDRLQAPPVAPHAARVDDLSPLPRTRGVYALYDADKRLLYIGKAANVRARVGSHARGTKGAGHFDGWTRHIAEVEALPAYSELEALLIEADLITRLRPPFNRHMRSWSRYCYIRVTARAQSDLAASRQPSAGETCYGPFRGRHQAEAIIEAVASGLGTAQCPEEHARAAPLLLFESNGGEQLCDRYFDGRCRGPCAGRIEPGEYARLLRQRHALLAGLDDAALVELEALLPDADDATHDMDEEDPYHAQRSGLTLLRSAFEHAATLRAAERLLNGWIILPGPEAACTVAVPTGAGIHFLPLADDAGDAERFLRDYQGLVSSSGRSRESRLARSITDALSVAARFWRTGDATYTFVPHHDARAMGVDALLTIIDACRKRC
jgi:hypothetical protein